MSVGVLAVQGDFAEHVSVLHLIHQTACEIRSLKDIPSDMTHLIIPGGESTVISRFLQETGVGDWIISEAQNNRLAVFGMCAGAILLATEATGKNAPHTLALIDITVERNAYGTQRDSFSYDINIKGIEESVHTAFIRAPRITRVGNTLELLATFKSEPVLVRSQRILAGTFHPEVRQSSALHQFFLSL